MSTRFKRSGSRAPHEEPSTANDLSRVRSMSALARPLSYTREILVETNEPDLPKILIYKIDRSYGERIGKGSQILARVTQHILIKYLHFGFCRLSIGKNEDNKNNEPPFSAEFIANCGQLTKFAPSLAQDIVTRFEPCLQKEMRRYQQLRSTSASSPNQTVLYVFSNNVKLIRHFQKQVEEQAAKIGQLQENGNSANYSEIEKYLKKADQELRKSLERHQKIEEAEIKIIAERQLREMAPQKNVVFIESRIFLMAMLVKAISKDDSEWVALVAQLEELLKISNNLQELEAFKSQRAASGRSAAALMGLAKKFIEVQRIERISIKEEQFLEDEEYFKEELKAIAHEIHRFIAQARLGQAAHIFPHHKPTSKEEIQAIVNAVIELAGLIAKDSRTGQERDFARLLHKFYQCLEENDYEQWTQFVQTLDSTAYNSTVEILEKINDYFGLRIAQKETEIEKKEQEHQNQTKQIQQELTAVKKKHAQLQQTQRRREEADRQQAAKQRQAESAKWAQQLEEAMSSNANLKKEIEKLQKAIAEGDAVWELKYNEARREHENIQHAIQAEFRKKSAEGERKLELMEEKMREKESENQRLGKEIQQKGAELDEWQKEYRAGQEKINRESNELKKTVKKLENEAKSAVRVKKALEDERKEWTVLLGKKDEEIKVWTQKFTSAAEEIQGLTCNFAEEARKMHGDSKKAEQKHQQLQAELSSARARLAELQKDLREGSEQEWKTRYDEVHGIYLDVTNELRAERARAEKLQTEICCIKKEMEQLAQQNKELEHAQTSLNQEVIEQERKIIAEVEQQSKEITREREEWHVRYTQERRALISTESDLINCKVKIEELNHNICILESEKQNLIAKIEEIREQYQQLQVVASETRIGLRLAQESLKSKEGMEEKLYAEIEKEKKKNETYITQISTLQSEGDRSHIQLQSVFDIDEELYQEKKKSELLQSQLVQHREKNEILLSALREKEAQIHSLSFSLQEMQQIHWKIDESRQKEESLLRKIEVMSNALETQRTEIEKRNSQIQQLEEKTSKLREGSISKENLSLLVKKETEKHMQSISKLTRDLENLRRNEKQLEELNRELSMRSETNINISARIQSHLRTLEAENNELKGFLQASKEKTRELDHELRENRKMAEEVRQLRDEVQKANRAHQLIETQKQELQRANAQQQQLITENFRTISNLEEENSKKRAAAGSEEYCRVSAELQRVQRELIVKQELISQLEQKIPDILQQHQSEIRKLNIQIQDNSRIFMAESQCAQEEITGLRRIIAELDGALQEQKQRSESAVHCQNVVILLSNVLSKFSQVKGKKNLKEEEYDRIFKELMEIKKVFSDNEEEFYMNLESYAVGFIKSDIGRYRAALIGKIDYITDLKERFEGFLSREIELARQMLNVEFEYEAREPLGDSTEKVHISTPIKISELDFTQEQFAKTVRNIRKGV